MCLHYCMDIITRMGNILRVAFDHDSNCSEHGSLLARASCKNVDDSKDGTLALDCRRSSNILNFFTLNNILS